MSYPNSLARIAVLVGLTAGTSTFARPPAPTPTFYISATPDSNLLKWGVGIIRPDGSGGYNLSFQAGFPDLEGTLTTIGRGEVMVYPTHSGALTMPIPVGSGDIGYFILGRYQSEIPEGLEAGVTVGMDPASATVWTSAPAKTWDVTLGASSAFPDVSENSVYNDLADPSAWSTSATGTSASFLSQLYAISAKSSIPLGATGSPSQIDLTLVTFSEAFTGGNVILSTNPVPEASTWAAAFAALGTLCFAWQRRQRPQGEGRH